MSQNNVANLPQSSFQPDNSNGDEQEGGDFQMPSFLSGVKGFAKMYSAPLRMGINAIKGFTTGKKSANQSQQTSDQCAFIILNPIGTPILAGGLNPYVNPILSYNQYQHYYLRLNH